MSKNIYVTGLGMISAIGINIEESLQSVKQLKSGIGKLNHIASRHKGIISVGEVKFSTNDLKDIAGLTSQINFTRTALLGIIAAREAICSANITDINLFKTGIISATSVGGMALAENHYLDCLNIEKNVDFLKYITTLDCSDSTERIADALGITEFLSTISTACSSSANAIMLGARLIKHGILERVIVGGTDSLSRFTINGFLTLKILDETPCRPFDANRNGLNLGEGAGFIVLESEKSAQGKKILAQLTGYANSNDAYHQTTSSPNGEGAYIAMKKSLEMSGLHISNIDYINAHGTGTELNDLSEGMAIERLFKDDLPPISSTKSFTGHTLAAAGGIEAVLSVLAIQNNFIYPNLFFENAMPELHFKPESHLINSKKINNVLSNSFGFGGNTSSLIFSRN